MAAVTAGVIGATAAVGGVLADRSAARGQQDIAQQNLQQQEQARADNIAFTREMADRTYDQAVPLFGAASDARRAGAQGSLDVLGGAVPQQLSALEQGSMGAQQALLSGLPQYQNAILGMPVDYSQLQPQTVNVDTSFLSAPLAPATDIGALLAPAPQEPAPAVDWSNWNKGAFGRWM